MAELSLVLGTLGGVGALITAIVVALKLGPEKVDIKIGSADRVMLGQDRFIDQLEQSVERAQTRIDGLEAELGSLRQALLEVTQERDQLRRENTDLAERVQHLEHQVAQLSDERHHQ